MSLRIRLSRRPLLVAAAAAALLGTALPALAQNITLKASHSAAPTEPFQVGMADFARRVKEGTNGRVTVNIFPNNQLGNEREVTEGLQLGLVDMANPSNAVLTNFVPDLVALDMPFLFRGPDHVERMFDGPLTDAVAEAVAKKGYVLLGLYTAGTRHIMTKKPVNSLADLKGQKIRVMQNNAHVETFKMLGANPTPLAYGELYGALQSGVVDGAEAANTNYHAQKFYEVSPNWAMVSWNVLVSPFIMAESRFKALPADVQKVLLDAGRASARVERAEYARSDVERLQALKAAKVNVTQPDVAEFRKAVAKVYDQFIKTDGQKKLFSVVTAP
ncbi:TRAP transporter substrate-binding protein [Hydrogenophaga sp.]|uniref:TRAP transporter substrate-binding protein n=1 Tax=Hydrogenophaga sp. TaxID=1904254 RepID=UPI002618DCE0|nr:TRAP transporter substrate-binding protein [Hydrogenophaga sp.]MCW5655818.1 TRAP transporter substrate-binding protein [Hydrogenophaga sp.]